jgi:Fe-Mn family superoxide dismutase
MTEQIIKPIIPDFISSSNIHDINPSNYKNKSNYTGDPVISMYQNKTHYNGHYLKYINKLNELIITNNQYNKIYKLIEQHHKNNIRVLIILTGIKLFDQDSLIYRNASQIYNHELYWSTITNENNSNELLNQYKNKLFKNDKEFDKFKEKFVDEGIKQFGSGWLWIYYNIPEKKLDVFTTHDSQVPFNSSEQIILGVIDLWEHAYYLDYQADRKKYLEQSLNIINWKNIYLSIG